MKRENFKILIDLYGEGKRDLIEYFEFSKQIEFINNMSNEQFNKLRNEVIDYYSFVLEKFGNVDELENITNYVLLCYKIGGLNGVETFVSERFCDENYQMELNESNNNMLYAETFKKIKSIFEKINLLCNKVLMELFENFIVVFANINRHILSTNISCF